VFPVQDLAGLDQVWDLDCTETPQRTQVIRLEEALEVPNTVGSAVLYIVLGTIIPKKVGNRSMT
jgi:hypothetical protein